MNYRNSKFRIYFVSFLLVVGLSSIFLYVIRRNQKQYISNSDNFQTSHNIWQITTVESFKCHNISLSEAISKFNDMHISIDGSIGKFLRIRLDESPTVITGMSLVDLPTKDIEDMLSEANASIQPLKTNFLQCIAHEVLLTMHVDNISAYNLLRLLLDYLCFPVNLILDGPTALIRNGPKTLKFSIVKVNNEMLVTLPIPSSPEIVNITTFFRESRCPLSVRYNHNTTELIFLSTTDYDWERLRGRISIAPSEIHERGMLSEDKR